MWWGCLSELAKLPDDPAAGPVNLHATSVSVDENALLLLGASGTGKSGLALQMMALGATLVADDRVVLSASLAGPIVEPAPNLAGRIEARGLGILRSPNLPHAVVQGLVNLDVLEIERSPPVRHHLVFGHALPLLHKIDAPYFAAALMQFITHGLDQEA